MSIKTTVEVTRQRAIDILQDELDLSSLSNKVLGHLLDVIADSDESTHLSYFNNYIVSDREME